jgi:hypothetical protein
VLKLKDKELGFTRLVEDYFEIVNGMEPYTKTFIDSLSERHDLTEEEKLEVIEQLIDIRLEHIYFTKYRWENVLSISETGLNVYLLRFVRKYRSFEEFKDVYKMSFLRKVLYFIRRGLFDIEHYYKSKVRGM